MTKQNEEKIEILEKMKKEMEEAKNENYVLNTGFRKTLNMLNTLCAERNIKIIENKEWTKYGCSVISREVSYTDIPALLQTIKDFLQKLTENQKIKREFASTIRGEISYAKSAIKAFGLRNTNESYRDAQARLTY